ncbi:hypothetical protein OHB56_01745 [Streptomyces sp. NBC_01635]|uniref:hypothetical protein n=1 Tax=Streptomyces sp. NBC_01635 TaxID=2975904 RepID=UPI003863BAEF|nr:hypothetical protein OHB56_01745 [Streptomyces sp. NBC_01635]
MDQLAAEGHVLARPLLRMVSLLATAPMPPGDAGDSSPGDRVKAGAAAQRVGVLS